MQLPPSVKHLLDACLTELIGTRQELYPLEAELLLHRLGMLDGALDASERQEALESVLGHNCDITIDRDEFVMRVSRIAQEGRSTKV